MKLPKDRLKEILAPLKPFDNSRGQFIINCPKCSHRECGISYEKEGHPWGCYRKSKCPDGTGTLFTIAKYLGIKLHYKKDVNAIDDKLENINANILSNEQKILSLPNIQMPLGYKRIFQNDYLDGRGFTSKDYQYWEVGKTSILPIKKKYCYFPIYQDDGIKAYVGRYEGKAPKNKYDNSNTDFSSLIGGFDKITDNTHTAIVCEGKLDIINVNRLLNLYDCEQIKPICTFGAKFSSNQINRLRSTNITDIILLFDNDVIHKIKPISFELELFFNTLIATIEGDNDPGDCSLDQLLEAIDNTQSPFDFFVNRM